jgi:hypothetical protein
MLAYRAGQKLSFDLRRAAIHLGLILSQSSSDLVGRKPK